jgi:hypothetical protein
MAASDTIKNIRNDAWRTLLERMLGSDPADRQRATNEWKDLDRASWRDKQGSPLWCSVADGIRILEVAVTTSFPDAGKPEDGFGIETDLCGWFMTFQHPAYVEAIEQLYPHTQLPFVQGSLLAMLSIQQTPEAVESIRRIVRQHGLSLKTYPRFFSEIARQTALTASLAPDLLQNAGEQLGGVANFVNACLANGHLDPTVLSVALPSIESRAAASLQAARPFQQPQGIAWRWAYEYHSIRHDLAATLDLLGVIPDASPALLREAQSLDDPRVLLFATIGLLRKGEDSPDETFTRIAACHETRVGLFGLLEGLQRLDRFPTQFRNLESFAASDMVAWLSYPSELGGEPEALHAEAMLSGAGEHGDVVHFLWRFTGGDNKECAGVSGPYPAEAGDQPVSGANTFSNFTEWSSATPEQHLAGVLETLERWSIARC